MHRLQIYLLIFSFYFIGCKSKENKEWSATFHTIISYSSPKAADLNGDKIDDIVMGAGGEEWSASQAGVIAVDGADGKLLWMVAADNQVYGSASFIKINDDYIPDVIIGGRSAQLKAIDGKSGKVIWSFFDAKGDPFASKKSGWFNFSNPIMLKDQDGDDIQDFIIANGGDATLAAEMKNRPPGRILLFSGASGKILAESFVPDLRETYLSPVCIDCESSDNPSFIFGSGGETMPGHLYISNLQELKNKRVHLAKAIDSTVQKGYEAPPILIDINQDKIKDIIFNTCEGSTVAIDGKSYQKIWSVRCDSSEIFSQPAVGYFYGGDMVPDVFCSYATGNHPRYTSTKQWLIDGKTGKVVWKSSDYRFTYSSPLVADLNNDGYDEVIQNSVNDSIINGRKKPYYELKVYDFKNNKNLMLANRHSGACFGSTPLLADIDHDGKSDLIYSGSPAIVSEFPGNSTFILAPLALSIHRVKLDLPIDRVKYGQYMQ